MFIYNLLMNILISLLDFLDHEMNMEWVAV